MQSDVQEIIRDLHEKGIINYPDKVVKNGNGTTDGLIYTLSVTGEQKYVLKLDHPANNNSVVQLLRTYRNSALFPQLLYSDPSHAFIVYTYIPGTTHYNRGLKKDWMSLLVKDLLNRYVNHPDTDLWGRLEYPRQSWLEFNERSVEGAREYIGDRLPIEDYHWVKSLSAKISRDIGQEEKRLLHGDLGVHNFVFHRSELAGIIDPSPMAGPALYDFTYAFCSSPDDLNLETLFATFDLLDHRPIERQRLIQEVVVQLYCRIGICILHHPHDLAEYLKAWDYWRTMVR
jgi:hypothetical protein